MGRRRRRWDEKKSRRMGLTGGQPRAGRLLWEQEGGERVGCGRTWMAAEGMEVWAHHHVVSRTKQISCHLHQSFLCHRCTLESRGHFWKSCTQLQAGRRPPPPEASGDASGAQIPLTAAVSWEVG